jgi:hypothetical protein
MFSKAERANFSRRTSRSLSSWPTNLVAHDPPRPRSAVFFQGPPQNQKLPTVHGLAPESTKQARYTFGPMSALRPQDVLQSLPAL